MTGAVEPTDKMVEDATAAHVAAFSKLPSNPSPQEAEQYAKQAMRVALTAAFKARDATSHRAAKQCRYTIEKDWPGHRVALSRRRCKNRTNHESGYCHIHRPAPIREWAGG